MLVRTMSASTPPTLAPGAEILGQYVLRQRVGQGMGGETWRAAPVGGGAEVAIKVVQHGGLRLRQHRDLIREAGLLRDLDHPHVVPYLGMVDFPGAGATFLIVAWASGGNLGSWMVGRGRLPTSLARGLALQLCEALQATHAAGILHRDLKPENVLLRDARAEVPHLMLADFGISQRMAGNVADVTRPAGSPGFTAPECWQSGAVSAAADVYSLGALLLTFLRGTPPPLGPDGVFPDVKLLATRVDQSVEADARPLARMAVRMLAARPEDRPSLAEVRAVLEQGAPPVLGIEQRRVATIPAEGAVRGGTVVADRRAPAGRTIVPPLAGPVLGVAAGGVGALLLLALLAGAAWWLVLGPGRGDGQGPGVVVTGTGEGEPEPDADGASDEAVATVEPRAVAAPSRAPGDGTRTAPGDAAPAGGSTAPPADSVPEPEGTEVSAVSAVSPAPRVTASGAAGTASATKGGPLDELRVGVQSPGGFPADVRLVVRAPGLPEAQSASSQLTLRDARAGAVSVEVRSSTRTLAATTVTVPEGTLVRVLCTAPEADFSGLACQVRGAGG